MSVLSPPGILTPSTLWVPPRLGTYGDVVNGFATTIGIPRDLEQHRDIDCLASYGAEGRWLTTQVAMLEGRQNGKTKSVALAITLADFFVFNLEPDRIFWTSHKMSTTLDVFNTVLRLIEENPELSKRVKYICKIQSKEHIELHDGSILAFVAREGPGGPRGLNGKRIVFDEALFLTMANMGAFLPTMSSKDNPQVMFISSAGLASSDFLRSLQVRGRRLNDPSLIFIEYKAPGGWDDPGCERGLQCDHIYGNDLNGVCSMDVEENWMMANHALHRGRMRLSVIQDESRTLRATPEGVLEFGRERMGWSELGGVPMDPNHIPKNLWASQTDPKSSIVDEVCFAVDMNPAGTHVSITAGGLRADGSIHFGLIDYIAGTEGVAKRLLDLTDKHETLCGVLWCPDSPIGALRKQFEDAGVFMVDVSMREYTEACGAFRNHIVDGHDAWHTGSRILNEAFEGSVRVVRQEGGWIFGRRKSSGDISPLVGSVLVVKGVDDTRGADPDVYSF